METADNPNQKFDHSTLNEYTALKKSQGRQAF